MCVANNNVSGLSVRDTGSGGGGGGATLDASRSHLAGAGLGREREADRLVELDHVLAHSRRKAAVVGEAAVFCVSAFPDSASKLLSLRAQAAGQRARCGS